MTIELSRLAVLCGLARSDAHEMLMRTTSPVMAATFLRGPQTSATCAPIPGHTARGGPSWAIWLPVTDEMNAALNESKGRVRDGSLSLRFIAGLPVMVLRLIAGKARLALAVPVWNADARSWIWDVVAQQRISLVCEPPGGESSSLTGCFKIDRGAVESVLDYEYSVDDADRGQALWAAALLAMASLHEQREVNDDPLGQSSAGVVVRGLDDIRDLAAMRAAVSGQ